MVVPIVDRESSLDGLTSERIRSSKVLVFAVILVAVLMIGGFAGLIGEIGDSKVMHPSETPLRTPAGILYTSHSPILINGNANFTNASGVVWGSGVESDPYILEGWDIQGSIGISRIVIQSTSAHFLIRDCYLHDSGVASGGFGISLLLCSNGVIERCMSVNNDEGIEIGGCTGIIIRDSYCSMNSKGVDLVQSYHNLVINNTLADGNGYGLYFERSWDNVCQRNNLSFNDMYGMLASGSENNTFESNVFGSNGGPGMRFESSDNNTLVENTCSFNDYGIDLAESSNNNTLCNNTCSNNTDSGIFLESSNNNTLGNNTCDSNDFRGIYLHQSSNNTVINNNCSNNIMEGIYLDSSSNRNTLVNNTCSNGFVGIYLNTSSNGSTLTNNTCSNNWAGIFLVTLSNSNSLFNNTCSGNQIGIDIQSSDYNLVSKNLVCNNDGYGVCISTASQNRIWNNTFVGNNGAGSTYNPAQIQAFDDGMGNRWNSTDGYGNNWSDWTTPDANHDGIVDLPYSIAGSAGAEDSYPLTTVQTQIPEFSMMPLVVLALLIVIGLAGEARRKWRS